VKVLFLADQKIKLIDAKAEIFYLNDYLREGAVVFIKIPLSKIDKLKSSPSTKLVVSEVELLRTSSPLVDRPVCSVSSPVARKGEAFLLSLKAISTDRIYSL